MIGTLFLCYPVMNSSAMAAISVLAILSIDGCLSDNKTERSWVLRSDVYGIDEFYEAADPGTLVEADVANAGYVRELLAEGKVGRLIIYTVPYLSGGDCRLFDIRLAPSHWSLESTKVYQGDVTCTVYLYNPAG